MTTKSKPMRSMELITNKSYNEFRYGLFQTEAIGQPILENIGGTGRLIYREI